MVQHARHKEMLFDGRNRVHVNALCLGERIDLKPFDASTRLAASPLILAAGNSGCAALFRYGVVVLFGLDAAEEAAFLANIRPLVHDSLDKPIREDAFLLIDADASEQVKTEGIVLHEASVERIQILADILAKSVALERYEISMQEGFERIEPLASGLKKHGGTTTSTKDLLRSIGNALLIEHRMVNRIEIGDKPDLLWELVDLEPLHVRLVREYELIERRAALERRLGLVSRTVETVLDLLNHRRSLRVEWYIVILIVIEIFLTLYEMFFRHA